MSNNDNIVLRIKSAIQADITAICEEYESKHDNALKMLNIAFLSGVIHGYLEALIPIDNTYATFVSVYLEIKNDMDSIVNWTDELYRALKKEG